MEIAAIIVRTLAKMMAVEGDSEHEHSTNETRDNDKTVMIANDSIWLEERGSIWWLIIQRFFALFGWDRWSLVQQRLFVYAYASYIIERHLILNREGAWSNAHNAICCMLSWTLLCRLEFNFVFPWSVYTVNMHNLISGVFHSMRTSAS